MLTPSLKLSSRKLRFALAAAVWLASVLAGFGAIAHYQTEAGARANAPDSWPRASHLQTAPGRGILVMFVHPKCTCSRASLTELAVIMRGARDRLSATVVFLSSGLSLDELQRTSTWQAAGSIENTQRTIDQAGREASLFGALTSGQVLLYDREGQLAFSGGITGSRGHAGDNMGRRSVLASAVRGFVDLPAHDVFGCPLQSPAGGVTP